VTSVVYADDIVSRLSLRAIENLVRILVYMCSEEGKAQGVDADSISSLIEAYVKAENGTAKRWRSHLERIYGALTAVAEKQNSQFGLMYTGGSIINVIPGEDYTGHPEKSPRLQSVNINPNMAHLIRPRNIDSFGEIVCNPAAAVLIRHFPSNLKDFFRRNKSEFCASDNDNLFSKEFSKGDIKSSLPELACKLSVDGFPDMLHGLLKPGCPPNASILLSPKKHRAMYDVFSLHTPQVG